MILELLWLTVVRARDWSFDAQIICRALKRGVDIIEIPYYEPKRQGGRAGLKLSTVFLENRWASISRETNAVKVPVAIFLQSKT